MQSFTNIQSKQSIQSSLALLLNNDKTALSCSAGSAFPTSNLQIGMLCYRTDQQKLFIMRDAAPTWGLLADLSTGDRAGAAELLRDALVRGSAGNDGGSILLERPESGSTLVGHLAIRLKGNQLQFLDAETQVGFNIDIAQGAANAAQKIWHAGNHGANSGLDADKLHGRRPGNDADNIPISNRTLSKGLNAEMLGGQSSEFYAPLKNPVFKEAAYAPTPSKGSNSDEIATTAFVTTAISSVDLGSRLSLGGGTLTGNLTIATGVLALYGYNGNDTTSVIFMNSARDRYLNYDGINYNMPNAELYVNGGKVWHSGNIGTPLNEPYGVVLGSRAAGNCGAIALASGIETYRSGNAIAARLYTSNCRNCNCNCNCCCFPSGALVLMADGSLRNIAEVKSGDLVQGPTRVWEVDYLYVTKLGKCRDMMGFDDGSLTWSAEHTFWTRSKADGSQWLWSADPDAWRREVEMDVVGGLFDNDSLRSGAGHEFAHRDDVWRNVSPVVMLGADPETPLYLPIPKKGNSDRLCFVNGYLVSASVDQAEFDYTTFEWSAAAAHSLRGAH